MKINIKKFMCFLSVFLLFGCNRYEIDQGFNYASHETIVWYNSQMAAKWVIVCDSFTIAKVTENKIKAEKFIIELKKLESK